MVPILEDEIQNENYSLIKLLENINLHQINFGDDDHFINMNTQNDYNKIINMVH